MEAGALALTPDTKFKHMHVLYLNSAGVVGKIYKF